MSPISFILKSRILAYFGFKSKNKSCNSLSPDPNSESRASIATRIPVEILVIIFNFVGPSTPRNPYPYLHLSWVCRLWRSAIRDDARFWTVRRLNKGSYMNPLDITKGAIWHPNCRTIDFIQRPGQCPNLMTAILVESCRERIRTISFPIRGFNKYFFQPGYGFPSLEKLIVESATDSELIGQLVTFITASPRLQYMELPFFVLCKFRVYILSRHFSRIVWLKLNDVSSSFTAALGHNVLQTMPNLQILIMTSENRSISQGIETINEVIQLPKLRLLSLDWVMSQIFTFQAPNLDYLSVSYLGDKRQELLREDTGTSNHCRLLETFYFSQITHILVGIHVFMSGKNKIKWSEEGSVACISASNRLLFDCLPFKHFHENGFYSQPLLDDYLDLPAKNCFHVPFRWKSPSEDFSFILNRTTNLVELTLHCGALSLKRKPSFHSFLKKILDSAAGERITRLNIIQGRSFAVACTLLKGRRAPRLERLMYHNSFLVTQRAAFLSRCFKTLQRSRSKAGSNPLKILELRNFANVPQKWIQALENSGVQLIKRR